MRLSSCDKNKSVPKVQLVDAVHSVSSLSPGLRIPDIAFPLACPLSSAVAVSLTDTHALSIYLLALVVFVFEFV